WCKRPPPPAAEIADHRAALTAAASGQAATPPASARNSRLTHASLTGTRPRYQLSHIPGEAIVASQQVRVAQGRGREEDCSSPPAQIPAGAANAPGSSLGLWRRNGDRAAGVAP